MELSIQDVVRIAGTTSRTLRHYDAIGLLAPTRVGPTGTRHYDTAALLRLQRIMLLRQLGLGLDAIGDALTHEPDGATALRAHVEWLRQEQGRIGRQIDAIERTLTAMETEEDPMMDEMFDGFDHTEHREEVERRWGADAYRRSAAWWDGMTADERAAWGDETRALSDAWTALAAAGADATGAQAQALAARHLEWLAGIPGTPAADPAKRRDYLIGLGAMYEADPRFAANYGGAAGGAFVRAALEHFAHERL